MDRILEIFRALLTATADEATALHAELDELWPTLSDEDVAVAESSLLDLFEGIRAGDLAEDGIEARDVNALRVVTTGVESIRALAAQRLEDAAALDAQIAELEASLAAPAAETEPAPETEPVAETQPTPEPTAEVEPAPEPAAEVEPELETVTAAGRPSLGGAAARQPARTRPRTAAPAPVDPHVVLTATNGGRLDSMTAAADVITQGFNELGANAGKRVLVTARADYPAEQTFREADTAHNGQIMEAIVAAGQDPSSWSDQSLTAAGWCAPSPVDYGLVIQAVADRPVWDALPKVGMDRMGLKLPVSPTLSDVNVAAGDTDAAISLFTETDVDDGDFSKPIQAIDCPDFVDFRAYAVVKRLKFKNGAAVAYPENVSAWNTLTGSAWARKADSLLLGNIKNDAGTTVITEPDQVYGAAIDVIELLLRLGAYMRSAERTGSQARLRAALPAWIIDLMQADQARSGRSVYNDTDIVIARNKITDMLTSSNINPLFYLDTPINPTTQALDGPTQILQRQTDGSQALQWPCKVQFGLWFEGQYAVGDPGELNIGVVRDSTLNARNEFESFYEKYEALAARRGPEALWVTQTVAATGTYAAPIDGEIACETQAS